MKTIFVLEKDRDILDTISLVLAEEGFAVKKAKSLKELKVFLFNSIPDAILLDIVNPFCEEAEFCKELKALQWTKNISVIALSTSTQVTERPSKVNADDVIEKPFNLSNLIKVVRNQVLA